MRHAGSMVAYVDRAQVTHRNTMPLMYLLTLFGALVSSGRQ